MCVCVEGSGRGEGKGRDFVWGRGRDFVCRGLTRGDIQRHTESETLWHLSNAKDSKNILKLLFLPFYTILRITNI